MMSKATIVSKSEKKLVGRTEYKIFLEEFASQPSYPQVQEEMARLLNCSKDTIVVKNVAQQFGSSEAEALVYVYDSSDAMNRFTHSPSASWQ